jgi:hypothetical protein
VRCLARHDRVRRHGVCERLIGGAGARLRPAAAGAAAPGFTCPFEELIVADAPPVLGGIADLLDHRWLQGLAEEGAIFRGAHALELAMRGDDVVAHPQSHATVAGPAICRRVRDQARTHRVELDVALAVFQVTLRLHDGRAIAAFPQGAGAPVETVDVQDITPADVLHHARDRHRRRPGGQDMDMIAHQHIGVELDLRGLRLLLHASEEIVAVGLLEEEGLAIGPAHDEVLGDSGDEDALEPRHARSTTARPGGVQRSRRDCGAVPSLAS